MTNLLVAIPDFDIRPYGHIIPSLEKALVTTADLLSLDATDVAKRAQVPPGEVRKLTEAILPELQSTACSKNTTSPDAPLDTCQLVSGHHLQERWRAISTLDESLDAALGGGVAAGFLTEIVGESAAGKTQFLLTLLLSVQLPPPSGIAKTALYISTEAPLQTTRLSQILNHHPTLSKLPAGQRPSLNRIQSTHIHDLEAQDHIIRYQVPVTIQRHNVGLLVIDSIAANYRPEFDKGTVKRSAAQSFIKRANQVAQLGVLLRDLARTFGIAVVVANQVADRFTPEPASQVGQTSQHTQRSRPVSPVQPVNVQSGKLSQHVDSDPASVPSLLSTDDPLALDHQQCFFTGWGADPSVVNLKTPSLGLTWTNQLSTRIALLKQAKIRDGGCGEVTASETRRRFCIVFSAWCAQSEVDFEIFEGGIRGLSRSATNEVVES